MNINFNCIPEPFQDIVQGRPSRFPLSSLELFEILDNASERTFLCGTAVSMQKYIFDGDAVKIGLETKNLVACMSFLLEEKLVSCLPLIFCMFLRFCLSDSSCFVADFGCIQAICCYVIIYSYGLDCLSFLFIFLGSLTCDLSFSLRSKHGLLIRMPKL